MKGDLHNKIQLDYVLFSMIGTTLPTNWAKFRIYSDLVLFRFAALFVTRRIKLVANMR